MQHDEVIWQLIMHGHCSFRTKMQTQNFCKNEYNVTGLCNRSSCPLANSRYATIREENGRCYLYIKSVERAHAPNKMWQRIRLRRQYAAALAQVDEHLAYWPKFLVHKNKQRLTKITQYLIRMRKLQTKVRPKIVTMPARKEKMERRREAKAEVAAQLDRAIEKELLDRLQSGTYGDIYNFPTLQYQRVLAREATAEDTKEMDADVEADLDRQDDAEQEGYEEFVEDEEEEEEEEEIEWLDDDEVDFSEDSEDIEDYSDGGAESGDVNESGGDEEDEEAVAEPGRQTGPRAKVPGPEGQEIRGRADRHVKAGKGAAKFEKPSSRSKRRRQGGVELEYEEEMEDLRSMQRAGR